MSACLGQIDGKKTTTGNYFHYLGSITHHDDETEDVFHRSKRYAYSREALLEYSVIIGHS